MSGHTHAIDCPKCGRAERESIARALMEIFDERSEGSESVLLISPRLVVSSSGYTALQIGDWTIWDSEDENSQPEHGWTVESELAHVEGEIRDVVAALQALVTTTKGGGQ